MKKIFLWIKAAGIFLIALGCIHVAASPFVLHSYNNLNEVQTLEFLFMFITSGLGVILCGIVTLLELRLLKQKSKQAWIVLMVCSVYSTIMGIGAVATMMYNPFAYIMFFCGILLLVPVLIAKKEIEA